MNRPNVARISRRSFLKLTGAGLVMGSAGSLLAGCAAAPAAPVAPAEAPAATEAPAAAEAPAAEVQPTAAPAATGQAIKVWWWGEQEAPGLEKWLNDGVAAWQDKTGNTVELTLQDNASVIPEFQTASAANSAPDIQFLWNGIYHMESVWLDYLEPLDGLIPDDILKGSGATALSSLPGQAVPHRLVQRRSLLALQQGALRAGRSRPGTAPHRLGRLPGSVRQAQSQGYPTPITGGLKDGPWGEWYMGHGLTPNLDSPADAINLFIGELDWNEPRYHEHWGKLAEMWQAGYINDDMLSIDLYPGIDLFGAGKGAMTSVVVPLAGKQAEMLGGEKVGAMVFPASGAGKMNGLPIADSQGFGISSQSANKPVAADFLAFLHAPDRVNALYQEVRALPTDSSWDGATEIQDDLFKQIWSNWLANEDAVPYISNLMPVLFWTDAMFVNSQKIIGGEYTAAQAGENAAAVTQKWKEQNPDLVEKYAIWANDLQL